VSGAQTAAVALAQAIVALRATQNPDAASEARILLAAALGVERGQLVTSLDRVLNVTETGRYLQMIAARQNFQPISQILGRREFWSRRFVVTPDVLDPRPDSETLIAAALDDHFSRVLDLGTGSGALIVTLLAERAQATGLAVDISPAALHVAAQNAAKHGVSARLEFRESDWLAQVDGEFDLIICNPPYIDEAEWAELAPDVRDHEPKLALTPGRDGLQVYRALAGQLDAYLAPNGRVLFEIGYQQGAQVVALMQAQGWALPQLVKDINGHDRLVLLTKAK